MSAPDGELDLFCRADRYARVVAALDAGERAWSSWPAWGGGRIVRVAQDGIAAAVDAGAEPLETERLRLAGWRLHDLLAQLASTEPCRVDRGYCETHDSHVVPCPHGQAAAVLRGWRSEVVELLADGLDEDRAAPDPVGTLRGIAETIDGYDAQCAEAEYTDTGQAWDVLNGIRTSCRAALPAQLEPEAPA